MRILAAAIFCALAASFALCFLMGLFDEMPLRTGTTGPYFEIFREHVGPYRTVRQVLPDVAQYLAGRGAAVPARAFARFLDNPRTVKPENLRSTAGFLTDSLLPDVKSPYAAAAVPAFRAVTGSLRVRSFLTRYAGPLKFYPRLLRYCEREKLEMNGPVMEIYDGGKKRIEYIAPVK